MFVNLRVSSPNRISATKFSKTLFKLSNKGYLNFNFYATNVKRPKRKRFFIVLKSPHADKTAQDQFRHCTVSNEINLTTIQVPKLILLIKELQLQLFPDIAIKFNFVFKTPRFKTVRDQLICLKLYKLRKANFSMDDNILRLKIFNLKGHLILKTGIKV